MGIRETLEKIYNENPENFTIFVEKMQKKAERGLLEHTNIEELNAIVEEITKEQELTKNNNIDSEITKIIFDLNESINYLELKNESIKKQSEELPEEVIYESINKTSTSNDISDKTLKEILN